METIRLRCAKCSKLLKVPQKFGGRVVACPNCQQKLRVPEPVLTAALVEDDEPVAVRKQPPAPEETPEADASEQMRGVDWVMGVVLFPIAPLIALMWGTQGNAKWKPMLLLGSALCMVAGGIAYWQRDAWLPKQDEPVTKTFAKSDYKDPDAGGELTEDEADMMEEHRKKAEKEQKAAEKNRKDARTAMTAPPAPEDLEAQPEHIQRAMRANVLLQIQNVGLGSGILCRIDDGNAYILTNRHVVDQRYAVSRALSGTALDKLPEVDVTYVNNETSTGTVIWMAADNVDLAVVKAECPNNEIAEANWRDMPGIIASSKAFAVGNPVGYGWTVTTGTVSGLRNRSLGGSDVPTVQTDANINPGNSGGGLYNAEGQLIGINNYILRPSVATGMGFAIRANFLKVVKPKGLNVEELDDK